MLLLASRSPRRVELLHQLGLEFEVLGVDVDETWENTEPAADHVLRLATTKAARGRELRPALPVLGADTAVVVDDQVFGKPRDRDHAIDMLSRLSGRGHEVYSAVALAAGAVHTALNITQVCFRPISQREIEDYWATGEPADKAGAYAIQGLAAAFIERIEGSYSGVMGLPLYETAGLLARDIKNG